MQSNDPFADIPVVSKDPFADIPKVSKPYKYKPRQVVAGQAGQYDGTFRALGPDEKAPDYVGPISKGMQLYEQISPEDYKAAQEGINIDTKLDTGTSFKAGFAGDDLHKQAFVIKTLSDKYGLSPEQIKVDSGGGITFQNPETGEWQRAGTNAASLVGESIPVAGATAGGLLGSVAGSSLGPAGTGAIGVAGAGVGGTIGEAARLSIGRAMGVNADFQGEDIPSRAFAKGWGEYALQELGTGAAMALGKGGKIWLFGKEAVTPFAANEILTAQKANQKLVDQISAMAGREFKPDTSQMASRGALSGTESVKTFASNASKIDDPYIQNLRNIRAESNERALSDALENTLVTQRQQGIQYPSAGGRPMQEALVNRQQQQTAPLAQGLATAEQGAAKELGGFPVELAGQPNVAGMAIRDAVMAEKKALSKVTDNAYAEYEKAIGLGKGTIDDQGNANLSLVKIPLSRGFKDLQRQLDTELRAAYVTGLEAPRKAALLKNIPVDEAGKEYLDLGALDLTLKDLRSDLRRGTSLAGDNTLDSRVARKLVKELTGMRNKYLAKNNPEIYDLLLQAEKAQKVESNAFRRGMMKDLVRRDKDGFLMSNADVATKIVASNDVDAAAQLASITKADPQANLATQNYLMAYYRNAVASDAEKLIPDLAKHKQFMLEHGQVYDQFFGPENTKRIRSLGGMAEVISKNTEALKLADATFKRTVGGKIARLSPDALVTGTLSNAGSRLSVQDVENLVKMKKVLGAEPIEAWRAGVAENLRAKLFDGDYIRPDAITNLLTKNLETVGKLEALYGKPFVNNLRKIDEAMKMVRSTERSVTLPKRNTIWSDIARVTYAPPLSREGVLVSAGIRSRAREFQNKLYDALSDPAELEKLGRGAEDAIASVRAAMTLTPSAYKLYALTKEEEFND